MNNVERHQVILNHIQDEGFVQVLDLCKELNVSSVTIRKDLKLLEDKKKLFRTHGGATLVNPYAADKPVNEKERLQSDEKSRIAAAAAQLIEANDSVLIASGTTVLALARAIQPVQHLSVITSALNVALELLHHEQVDVIQLGGTLRKSSASVIGATAQHMLDDFACSKLFLGVDGIDLQLGLSTTNVAEAQLNRQMIKASQKVIVLADSTKFGRRGFSRICGLEEVSQIITDKDIPDHYARQLAETGIEVTVV